MGRICGKITASIGLIVLCQTASAALDSSAAMMAGDLSYRNMLQPDGSKSDARLIAAVLQNSGSRSNNSGARFDLGQPGVGPLAQAGPPAAPAPSPASDSNTPRTQSAPPVSSPPNPTSTAVVVRAGPSATGCGLKYLAAELAGKLKGRKWKEFREEECGAITTQAVFPSAIAPKYSGESPDKARTLTCADQFKANKATNANDGMKWIEKGGGYYSECVSRLKG
jgi:hypothetical protein